MPTLGYENNFTIVEDHIYFDHAQSESRKVRHGLSSLLAASRNHPFDIVLVDDLSRLARNNFLMLAFLANLSFCGVRVFPVSDDLNSNDEEVALGIQIR